MKKASLLLMAALCACGKPAAPAHHAPAAALLIDKRGVVMPLRDARANIGFTPLIPQGRLLATAVIPPLGGTDNRATHGIAMEYENGGQKMLLSQWPRAGYSIGIHGTDAVHHPCGPLALGGSASGSVLWTTRNGLVMTLQPDGAGAGPHVAGEAKRLIAVCRLLGLKTSRLFSRPR